MVCSTADEEVRASSRTPGKLPLPGQVQVFAADLNEPASFATALECVERVLLYADLEEPEELLASPGLAGLLRSGMAEAQIDPSPSASAKAS